MGFFCGGSSVFCLFYVYVGFCVVVWFEDVEVWFCFFVGG